MGFFTVTKAVMLVSPHPGNGLLLWPGSLNALDWNGMWPPRVSSGVPMFYLLPDFTQALKLL